ncbi:MAG: nucleoside recognition domain-containing protein [Opitutales bacterium]
MRWNLPRNFHDRLTESLYGEANRIASARTFRSGTSRRIAFQRTLDTMLTNPWTGFPLMALLFTVVLWMTIAGANVPSGMLFSLLIDNGVPFLKGISQSIGLWSWLDGFLIDGIYLTCAWVISVMLPPMAIFFPLFTLLEDLGYLPRVAFNMDRLFQKAGAHGKQSLTMTMGLGCNAAGVIAARVIDSPRERLIAIITNNFSLCNGRWPTQIMIAAVFLGALVPAPLASLTAAVSVFSVAAIGFILAFVVSWALSRTVLRGEASAFTLELPPYRPPRILRTLYTSIIDRTLFVLWRAIVFAVPAGAAIWLTGNIHIGGETIAWWMVTGLDPVAWIFGLTGIILVAYIVAIPANEIVIPTILMLTVHMSGLTGVGEQGAGVMFETEELSSLREILLAGGWTTLTAVCLMLFSLCHNPCSTTIYTIYKETGSAKWTTVATLLPVIIGMVLCAGVALVWRLF